MKTIEQNHYEFLGIELDAPAVEVRRAVAKLREVFAPGSIALYSLVDQEEHKALLDRLEEAVVVLTDERARLAYNERHGLGRRVPEPPKARARQGPAAQLDLPVIVGEVDRAPAWPGTRGEGTVEVRPDDVSSPGAEPIAPASTETEPISDSGEPAAPVGPVAGMETGRGLADVDIEVEVELDLEEEPAASLPAVTPKAAGRLAFLPPMPELGPETQYDGDLLRRIREARGVTLRELATRTRISLGHLEHLEAEAFRELPERVYLRGFLIAYARELKLDGPRLAETYLARWAAGRRS